MITAKIICDSINRFDVRLTSWILTYNRFFHSELLTHRMFSRNSASSRAIPIAKTIADVLDEPAMPAHWGRNQSGMQANSELDEDAKVSCAAEWLEARDDAVKHVKSLSSKGLHKQVANRIIEPWMHMTVLLTATDFENFFSLRAQHEAQPEFQVLANFMLEEYNKSIPKYVPVGDWHIPFGDKLCDGLSIEQKLKVATARAARVSYKTFEGEIDYEKDFALHDRLVGSGHWSPMEHCAKSIPWMSSNQKSNFGQGWMQYRKTFPNERRRDPRVIRYTVHGINFGEVVRHDEAAN